MLDEHADIERSIDGEKGCLAALRKLKLQNPHLKTLLSVGGGSGSANFPTFAASSVGRENFARSAREFVQRFSLDGIDGKFYQLSEFPAFLIWSQNTVDWEHPKTPSQGQDFVELLRATRIALPNPHLLTTALPTGQYCLKNINLLEASRELDLLNLMAYDFTGSWTEVSGHQAQLFSPPGEKHACLQKSCHAGVDYVLSKGFPAEKVLLGVPAYARYFPGATGPGQSFNGGGELDYDAIPAEWIREARVDEEYATAFYVDPEKGFVSFDVPATVGRKARYVRERRLAGLFYWTGVGDVRGPEGLVDSGWRELNGR